MAIEAFFSFKRRDLTGGINARNAALVSKGIVSGGAVSPSTANSKVRIALFKAVSFDGMVLVSDTAYEIETVRAEKRHICLRAKYREANATPELQFYSLSDADFEGASEADYLIKFAEVTQSGAIVVNDDIDMVSEGARDEISVQNRNAIQGSVEEVANLPSQSAPKVLRHGDLYLVRSEKALYMWNGDAQAWQGWGADVYLPLTGGTLSGALQVNTDLTVLDDISCLGDLLATNIQADALVALAASVGTASYMEAQTWHINVGVNDLAYSPHKGSVDVMTSVLEQDCIITMSSTFKASMHFKPPQGSDLYTVVLAFDITNASNQATVYLQSKVGAVDGTNWSTVASGTSAGGPGFVQKALGDGVTPLIVGVDNVANRYRIVVTMGSSGDKLYGGTIGGKATPILP